MASYLLPASAEDSAHLHCRSGISGIWTVPFANCRRLHFSELGQEVSGVREPIFGRTHDGPPLPRR